MIIEVLLLLVAVTTSDGSIYQNVFSAGENPEYTLEHCREIVVPTFLNSLYQDNTNIVDTHTQCEDI